MKKLFLSLVASLVCAGATPALAKEPDAGAWDPRHVVIVNLPKVDQPRARGFQWNEATFTERRDYLLKVGTPPKVAERAALGGVPLVGSPLHGDGRALLLQPQALGLAFIGQF
jgi:hypothetical protein